MKIKQVAIIITFFLSSFLVDFFGRAASPENLKKASQFNDSAIAKIKAGDPDGAEIDLLQALEYSGQNPKVQKNLGIVYYEKGIRATRAGNFYDAEKYLKSALGIESENERYIKALAVAISLEADTRARIGQNEEALNLYQAAAEKDPKNVRAWGQAAHYAWLTQRLDLAREYLERARAIDPQDKNVLFLEEKLKKSADEAQSGGASSLHFILSASTGDTTAKTVTQVLNHLEEVYDEVSYRLNFFPQNKISVVFYPADEFHEHWRLPSRVNGFYDGKLRIPYADSRTPFETLKPTIKHELTHAFISAMTKKPIPRWMNEGLAQWVEGRELDVKSKDALVTRQILFRVPDIAHLDNTLSAQYNPFNNEAMTLAYMKSFSLIQYLIQEHGVWSVVQWIKEYGSGVSEDDLFRKYFLATSAEVEEHWRQWLERKKSGYVFY